MGEEEKVGGEVKDIVACAQNRARAIQSSMPEFLGGEIVVSTERHINNILTIDRVRSSPMQADRLILPRPSG